MVATCTTIIVLAPLALMPGMGGFLFRPLALAVAFAMITSFLLSRTFVPMMCAKFLPDEHRHAGRETAKQGEMEKIRANGQAAPGEHGEATDSLSFFGHSTIASSTSSIIASLVDTACSWRMPFADGSLVLSVVGLLFAGSLVLALFLGREFFPQVDAGQITIFVRSPSNLRLERRRAAYR